MIKVEPVTSAEQWDEEVLGLDGHPLQLWGWGEVKAAHNWRAERVVVRQDGTTIGAAQLLIRPLPVPFNALVYIPRGPAAAETNRAGVLEALAGYVRHAHHAVALSIEPDWETMPLVAGWHRAANTILIPRTLIVDLTKDESELLAHMAKKTAQYIRKSERDGVEVHTVKTREGLAECLAIYKQTAARANFALHDDDYYYDVFDKLGEHSQVFGAVYQGKLVAFVWLAVSETTAFELYGGMNDEGQRLRANYTLKWKAIQTVKKWGVQRYDMNGLLNDGVSKFKQGFADHENMLAGTYDRPLSPLYIVWEKGLPLAKQLLRKLKNR